MNIANIGVGVYTDLARLHSGLRDGQSTVLAFAGVAATAFGSVATAAVAAGLAIDDALDGIRVSTGATGQALAGLEASFDRVFANVPNSAADASGALAQLSVRTGQTGSGLEALTTQVLTLARITKSDLNATVTDSAKVFQSWGIAANQQASTLDMVFRASQQTGIQVGALLQTMVTAGPVFRAAGFDFATSAALLGSFERAGVNGQRAVASLTAAFRFFGKEGIDAKRGVADTIARIQELGPGAASAALGVKVFGRSAVDMVAAIQSGRLNVDALVASISNGTDTIASAAKATDGFTETLAKLRNNAVLALEPFGTAVLAGFNTAMEGILAPSRALLTTLDLLAKAAIALSVAVGTRMVVSFIKATAAKVSDFFATQAALRANVAYTAAVAAQAQAQFVAATAALNAARAETALTGSLVAQRAALVAVGTAHAQAAAATAAHTAAMNAASLSARAAAASMNILKGVLAFFGGPIGLAITAVLTAVGIAFYNSGRKAREAASEARQAAEDFRAALGAMDEATFGAVARTQRHNYGVLAQAATQAAQRLEQQRATVARMTQEAGVDRFGEVRINPELRAAQALLAKHEENVANINRQWSGVAANVRSVREQEAALARQRATMPELPPGSGPGSLQWEGGGADADAKRFTELLSARASALTEIFEVQKAQGRDTSSVMRELNRIYEDAADNLRAMGDATRLAPEALQDYRSLLGIVQQLNAASIAGPAAVRQAPTAALAPTITVAPLLTGAERFARITKASAQDFGSTVVQKLAQGRDLFKNGVIEGANEAADTLRQASENVRGMWAGLLSGIPQQLGAFASMFGALDKRRRLQQKELEAGVEGATGPTGLAPFPGAVAFMLAAEALAPVMEALREPMAALMVPVQMAAAAFGPLLTSVVKALFPVMKTFGIAITYVAQVAGYVAGALLKVVGEIIRTVGSLISKIPGLGQEGKAIKDFGKGLTDASKEMFDMAKAMPGVRDELRNLDWDEAMKRAADSANRLADSLTNVPEVFDLIARRTQAMRGVGPQNVPPLRPQDYTSAPAPNPASQASGAATYVQQPVTVNLNYSPTINGGADKHEIEGMLRKDREQLIRELRMPGPNSLQTAVARAVQVASPA